jgi:RES domain-containing protein
VPTAWRITKAKFATEAFTGEGARLYGGRWNSVGIPLVYTSERVSLAALELLIHLQSRVPLPAYVVIPATFDQTLVESIDPAALPADWRNNPAPIALADLGDSWAASRRSAVLRVPSAVVPSEGNFLLNPEHPDFTSIRIGSATPFEFDARLLRS